MDCESHIKNEKLTDITYSMYLNVKISQPMYSLDHFYS